MGLASRGPGGLIGLCERGAGVSGQAGAAGLRRLGGALCPEDNILGPSRAFYEDHAYYCTASADFSPSTPCGGNTNITDGS